MRQTLKGICIGAALLLAACGPSTPAASQAASQAASAVNQAASALPSQAASAASQAASQAASAANQAAGSSLASQAASAANQAASAANQAASALPSPLASAVNQAASAASSALASIAPSDLKLQQDQPLVLSVTNQVAGVSTYRWTIAQAPPGAERVQGTKIAENSDGKLTIDPSDYAKYFPSSGNYVVNLDLVSANGTTNTVPITVVVP